MVAHVTDRLWSLEELVERTSVCVPKTSSGNEFGTLTHRRVAWRYVCRLGDAAIRKTWERTARSGLSESPPVLTGVCPLAWHGCQNHLERYQGFVSGSNPATPTIYLIDITAFFALF
jgi:hypothetical protein